MRVQHLQEKSKMVACVYCSALLLALKDILYGSGAKGSSCKKAFSFLKSSSNREAKINISLGLFKNVVGSSSEVHKGVFFLEN